MPIGIGYGLGMLGAQIAPAMMRGEELAHSRDLRERQMRVSEAAEESASKLRGAQAEQIGTQVLAADAAASADAMAGDIYGAKAQTPAQPMAGEPAPQPTEPAQPEAQPAPASEIPPEQQAMYDEEERIAAEELGGKGGPVEGSGKVKVHSHGQQPGQQPGQQVKGVQARGGAGYGVAGAQVPTAAPAVTPGANYVNMLLHGKATGMSGGSNLIEQSKAAFKQADEIDARRNEALGRLKAQFKDDPKRYDYFAAQLNRTVNANLAGMRTNAAQAQQQGALMNHADAGAHFAEKLLNQVVAAGPGGLDLNKHPELLQMSNALEFDPSFFQGMRMDKEHGVVSNGKGLAIPLNAMATYANPALPWQERVKAFNTIWDVSKYREKMSIEFAKVNASDPLVKLKWYTGNVAALQQAEHDFRKAYDAGIETLAMGGTVAINDPKTGKPIKVTIPATNVADPAFAASSDNPYVRAFYEQVVRFSKENLDRVRSNRISLDGLLNVDNAEMETLKGEVKAKTAAAEARAKMEALDQSGSPKPDADGTGLQGYPGYGAAAAGSPFAPVQMPRAYGVQPLRP